MKQIIPSAAQALAAAPGPVPPARMGLLRGTRPLKRWRYVGIFCDQLMACAASVHVGPAHQTFWAILSRDAPEPALRERTRLLPRRSALQLEPGRLLVDDTSAAAPSRRGKAAVVRTTAGRVQLDFELEEGEGVETVCSHGEGYVWTRKQAGVRARGVVTLDGGPPRAIEALATIDDTAGYHARVTEWRWAAGVGVDPAGTPLAFNLVEGVNDPPQGSERTVWVAGEPREVPAVGFTSDLSQINCEDGSKLRFAAEAQRHRSEHLGLVRSEYRAPFGTFSGTLPGGVELVQGLGVVEHHIARW